MKEDDKRKHNRPKTGTVEKIVGDVTDHVIIRDKKSDKVLLNKRG